MAVVYASATVSLAALELFVHVDPDDAPESLVVIPVDVPDDVPVHEIRLSQLPRNWRATPAPSALQRIGDRWARGLATAVLSVPSAIVPQERNYVLNPAHRDFRRLVIGRAQRFVFDPRMWK